MRCYQCKKVIGEFDSFIPSGDFDALCSEKCKTEYEEERDNFIDNILPNDDAYNRWLGIPDNYVKGKTKDGSTILGSKIIGEFGKQLANMFKKKD